MELEVLIFKFGGLSKGFRMHSPVAPMHGRIVVFFFWLPLSFKVIIDSRVLTFKLGSACESEITVVVAGINVWVVYG